MAANKTTETENSVEDFINTVDDAARRADSFRITEIFKKTTGLEAKMWGSAIIGFGSYHYKYDSGHEGDSLITGFSPRKDKFALYIPKFDGREALLEKFGKHKTSKGCIYIKKVDDINPEILKKMITAGFKHTTEKYPG